MYVVVLGISDRSRVPARPTTVQGKPCCRCRGLLFANLILGHRSPPVARPSPSPRIDPATANDDNVTDYGGSVSSTATMSSVAAPQTTHPMSCSRTATPSSRSSLTTCAGPLEDSMPSRSGWNGPVSAQPRAQKQGRITCCCAPVMERAVPVAIFSAEESEAHIFATTSSGWVPSFIQKFITIPAVKTLTLRESQSASSGV
ncbi:hypothetical protein DFH07DRAFT_945956 [Mycena maculata]|uniref:Uncharacterized protein n=1 Tax=Mycena maculata TaxID=230809 RepID=A0AAD7HTI8_9AGAR|nr:hypothetical protein DFH07DRAFT_945956 [Mycena maculata]